VLSTIDSTFTAENAGAPASVVRGSRGRSSLAVDSAPAPGVYPPLFHRPPPANY
jgi:hypothetical protein